jgi:hypothetical protein
MMASRARISLIALMTGAFAQLEDTPTGPKRHSGVPDPVNVKPQVERIRAVNYLGVVEILRCNLI